MDSQFKTMIIGIGLRAIATLAMPGGVSLAGEIASPPDDPAIARTRQEIKMLDDFLKMRSC